MVSKIRWWIANTLLAVAASLQLLALKVTPKDTEALERILKQSRSGESPDLPEVFDDDL